MARLNEIFDHKDKTVDENGVLINNLGITDLALLEEKEREITSIKLTQLYLMDTTKYKFDKDHYYSIHKYLFEDIYPFAGKTRNEPISKNFTFCLPQRIEPNLIEELKKANIMYKRVNNKEDLIKFVANLYTNLDFIHAFREGNGRCEREFIRQYVKRIVEKQGLDNYIIDYSKIQDKKAYTNAIIKADVTCDTTDLEKILWEITDISPNNSKEEPHFPKKR